MKKRINAGLCLFVLIGLVSIPVQAQGIFDSTADWELTGADNVKAEGSVDFSGGVYTLEGNGDDVWGNADEGFYVYTTKSGSWSIEGQVYWIDTTGQDWAKVGVMIREKGDLPGSKTYYALLRGAVLGDRSDAAWRSSEGGSSSSVQIFEEPDVPVEAGLDGTLGLRVTRVAETDLFFMEYSYDMQEWFFGHSMTLEMADEVAYGLFITNHFNDDLLAVAEVSNVELNEFSGVVATRSFSSGIYTGGETIEASIDLFNPGSSAVSVDVTELADPFFDVVSADNGGSISGSDINWSVSVPAGETLTLGYTIKAPDSFEGKGTWDGNANSMPIFGVNTISGILPLVLENKKEVPFLTNEITLDGEIGEDEYAGATSFTFDVSDPDNPPGTVMNGGSLTSHGMTVHLLHNNDYIYVALDVVDPLVDYTSNDSADVWRSDSSELYLDGNLSRLSTKEGNALGPQMTVQANGARAAGNDAPTPIELSNGGHYTEDGAYWNFGAAEDADGYNVEYQLSKAQMVDPPTRTLLGFDILINDASETGDRSGKWGWFNVGEDGAIAEFWDDETGWGLIELMEGTSVSEWALY